MSKLSGVIIMRRSTLSEGTPLSEPINKKNDEQEKRHGFTDKQENMTLSTQDFMPIKTQCFRSERMQNGQAKTFPMAWASSFPNTSRNLTVLEKLAFVGTFRRNHQQSWFRTSGGRVLAVDRGLRIYRGDFETHSISFLFTGFDRHGCEQII